jgi:hypothetical protein
VRVRRPLEREHLANAWAQAAGHGFRERGLNQLAQLVRSWASSPDDGHLAS